MTVETTEVLPKKLVIRKTINVKKIQKKEKKSSGNKNVEKKENTKKKIKPKLNVIAKKDVKKKIEKSTTEGGPKVVDMTKTLFDKHLSLNLNRTRSSEKSSFIKNQPQKQWNKNDKKPKKIKSIKNLDLEESKQLKSVKSASYEKKSEPKELKETKKISASELNRVGGGMIIYETEFLNRKKKLEKSSNLKDETKKSNIKSIYSEINDKIPKIESSSSNASAVTEPKQDIYVPRPELLKFVSAMKEEIKYNDVKPGTECYKDAVQTILESIFSTKQKYAKKEILTTEENKSKFPEKQSLLSKEAEQFQRHAKTCQIAQPLKLAIEESKTIELKKLEKQQQQQKSELPSFFSQAKENVALLSKRSSSLNTSANEVDAQSSSIDCKLI